MCTPVPSCERDRIIAMPCKQMPKLLAPYLHKRKSLVVDNCPRGVGQPHIGGYCKHDGGVQAVAHVETSEQTRSHHGPNTAAEMLRHVLKPNASWQPDGMRLRQLSNRELSTSTVLHIIWGASTNKLGVLSVPWTRPATTSAAPLRVKMNCRGAARKQRISGSWTNSRGVP